MAFGFSSDGMMLSPEGVNHTAVVGGWTPEVSKFDLVTKAGQQSMSALQTLQDASYENVDGSAVLKFTKLLVEEGEVPINVEGDNFFLYSWGNLEVNMGFHSVFGSITKDFAADVAEPTTNDEIVTEPATNDEIVPEPATNDEVEEDKSGAVSNALSAGTMAMAFGASLLI